MSAWIPARPDGPHPSPEELFRAWRYPEAEGSAPVRRHAAGCASCSEELLRLESFDRPEPAVDVEAAWKRFEARMERETPGASELAGKVLPFPESKEPRQGRLRLRPRVLALAASTLLAAGLAYFWVADRPVDEAEVFRGDEPAIASGEVFEPRGTLETPPLRFLFPPQATTPLMISLRSSDGAYQWASPASTTGVVELPAGERARLAPGVDYWWTVLGGSEVPAKRFRIGAK